MTKVFTFSGALEFAQDYAMKGLNSFPYDAIYQTALRKVEVIKRLLSEGKQLSDLPIDPDVGLMAAKELGNDDDDLAEALSVIQGAIDAAHEAAERRTLSLSRRLGVRNRLIVPERDGIEGRASSPS